MDSLNVDNKRRKKQRDINNYGQVCEWKRLVIVNTGKRKDTF